MPRTGKALILQDAGPAALLACACLREAIALGIGDVGEVSAAAFGVIGNARLAAVAQQCELFNVPLLTVPAIELGGVADLGREVHELVHVAAFAAENGIERVVWPATGAAGDSLDLDRISEIVDRAVLCGRLVGLDSRRHGVPSIRIETPYADFTDRQVADLIADMGLPVESCWFFNAAEVDAAADRERRRWTSAMEAVGYSLEPVVRVSAPKAAVR